MYHMSLLILLHQVVIHCLQQHRHLLALYQKDLEEFNFELGVRNLGQQGQLVVL